MGSCLTLRNESSKKTHRLTKQGTLLGRGTAVESQEAQGPQESCSATWLTVSDFMVMGLVSGLSLANRSDLGFFLVLCALLSQEKDSGRLTGHAASLFDLP